MEQQPQQKKMPSPSHQEAPPIAAAAAGEEEMGGDQVPRFVQICKMNEEIPSSPAAAEAQVKEFRCLSGDKPFFDIILSKTHVTSPYLMNLPSRAVTILPSCDVGVVVTHGDRKWNIPYNGSAKRPKFLVPEWRKFVEDNNLKLDDACIFEVMESSPTGVELKLVLLRNTKRLPPQLQYEIVEARGRTPETAIELD